MNTIELTPTRELENRDNAIPEDRPASPAHSAAQGAVAADSVGAVNFHLKDLFDGRTFESDHRVMPAIPPVAELQRPDLTNVASPSAAGEDQNRTIIDAASPFAKRPRAADDVSVDDTFYTTLETRMAKSDLEELGWRNRTDLDDVMRDLERLSGADWRKAATLWDKYRPGDEDKPISIDGDDKNAPRANDRTTRAAEAERIDAGSPPDAESRDAGHEGAARNPDDKLVIPGTLVKRYLVAENKFYFRDDPNLLAFEDKGKRLSTEHNDPIVARSMVELAEAKRWSGLKVKGTKEFRREVWRFATLRGLDVQGYEPSDVDKAELAERLQELRARAQNSIEQQVDRNKDAPRAVEAERTQAPARDAPDPTKTDETRESRLNLTKQQKIAVATLRAILTERGDSAKAVEMAAQLASERFQQQRVYVGRLTAHGSAPYNNDPAENPNYFVTLKTINGERTVWGVDLERALTADGARTGDDLTLVFRGKKRVTVSTHERHATGKTTGRQIETEVDRNTWKVGKLDTMREEARERVSKAASQSERTEPVVPVYDAKQTTSAVPVEPAKQRTAEPAPRR